jgi:hypothetical protein
MANAGIKLNVCRIAGRRCGEYRPNGRSLVDWCGSGAQQSYFLRADDRLVAANTFCGKVDVWSTATGARIGHELSFVGAGDLGPVRLSHDGTLLAVANSGNLGQIGEIARTLGRQAGKPDRFAGQLRAALNYGQDRDAFLAPHLQAVKTHAQSFQGGRS